MPSAGQISVTALESCAFFPAASNWPHANARPRCASAAHFEECAESCLFLLKLSTLIIRFFGFFFKQVHGFCHFCLNGVL